MKILGLTPARGGSKGIPGKNIKMLCGKPLIAYTIETALACGALTDFIVSTDDDDIAATSRRCGAQVPFSRPAALATDKAPTIDTVLHTLDFMEKKGRSYDAVCLLQATSPLRSVDDLTAAIDIFTAAETDSLISVIPVPHEYNPHWVFKPSGDGDATLKIATGEQHIITRRQALPPAFVRNGAIYLVKTSVLQKEKSLYGNSIGYYEMDAEYHINLDTPADWTKAEQLMGCR